MADAPPPWISDESEEEQHDALEPITGTLHVPGQQPKDTAMPERGGAMQDGEIGTGAHGSKQGFLLERRARLVAASDVAQSFSSVQPGPRVGGRLSNRSVHQGRGES